MAKLTQAIPGQSLDSHGYSIDHVLAETISNRVAMAARQRGESVYLVGAGGNPSLSDLHLAMTSTAERLSKAGIGRGSRVAVAMQNSWGHIVVVLALFSLQAVWIPINTRLRGTTLRGQVTDCHPHYLLSDNCYGKDQRKELCAAAWDNPVAEERVEVPGETQPVTLTAGVAGNAVQTADHTRAIMYTSGTTGPPKGVQVTESMLLASCIGAIAASTPQPGNVYYLWEPIYHIGGAQVLLIPLFCPVHIAMSHRFSVSKFWDEIRDYQATHLHYLGGVLQMLLAAPPSPREHHNSLQIAWGAGATPKMWGEAERRFGLTLRECYGMTETSSVVTVNRQQPSHGVGQPLPWFDVNLAANSTHQTDEPGEILVRGRTKGLITPGYLNHPNYDHATAETAWWHTGDLARKDDAGNLHFLGRTTDSIRKRGENVSAWQVESVFNAHPAVKFSAVLGVDAEIGEQEMKMFIVPSDDHNLDVPALIAWAHQDLADFQIPRYISVVDDLPLGASRRVRKGELSTSVQDSIDVDAISH